MGDKPTINVSRGRRSRPRRDASDNTNKSTASSALPGPLDVVSGVVQGVRSVWLAGLGAVGMLEDAGAQVFDALVEEGKTWHRTRAEERAAAARAVQQARDDETPTWTIEAQIRDEIDTVLTQAGVARRADVEALQERVEALSETVDRLAEQMRDASDPA